MPPTTDFPEEAISPHAAATTAPNLAGTTVSHDLADFAEEGPRSGSCIRCSSPVDPGSQDWASFGQVDTINQRLTITGGVFCGPCVEGWNSWMKAGRQPQRG